MSHSKIRHVLWGHTAIFAWSHRSRKLVGLQSPMPAPRARVATQIIT